MKIAIVRLREAGQISNFRVPDDVTVGDFVVVEIDRGLDHGEVMEILPIVQESDKTAGERASRDILRKFSESDKKQIDDNKTAAGDAIKLCSRKIRDYKLDMKLVDAEYSFDRKKIIFYFTADDRVDFRELVKELAKIFKIRIEMRQIGVRDEARMFGGVGPCGQSLCCVRWLKTFEPVTMKMAKTQRLSLSSGKISGICGRLMCCLFYEYATYKDLSRGLPKEGSAYDTPKGKGKVVSVNVLKRMVYVQLADGIVEKVCLGCPVDGSPCQKKPEPDDSSDAEDTGPEAKQYE